MTESNTSSYERVEENANVNRTTITEHNKLMPWLMLTCLLSGSAIVGVMFDMSAQNKTEREARMLQYYVMELDGKLMAAKVIAPEQSYSAQQEKHK